jgi:hypothetical protein
MKKVVFATLAVFALAAITASWTTALAANPVPQPHQVMPAPHPGLPPILPVASASPYK